MTYKAIKMPRKQERSIISLSTPVVEGSLLVIYSPDLDTALHTRYYHLFRRHARQRHTCQCLFAKAWEAAIHNGWYLVITQWPQFCMLPPSCRKDSGWQRMCLCANTVKHWTGVPACLCTRLLLLTLRMLSGSPCSLEKWVADLNSQHPKAFYLCQLGGEKKKSAACL